ncbi:Cd1 [Slackia heliotrinireducens]|uniref:NADPH-dependent FMN reductase n=1 Tax=Slackia heliotrinireducens (strain ATCC 29202 / DSM 20476 / NCTC 11029 / RHS 1) TaxID=471855 RepID=C7N4G9_SLAHD|nr:flavodoxin family protein [Slackia heliotrinireducens]ACV21804.1 NADPH-dependent FMN reductase [Slackia heliotrinireducens DSM 20476]VEG99505.1 Cd1 [Slackia heliotrinireducens]
MSDRAMIVVGSPRANGVSARYAELLRKHIGQRFGEIATWKVSDNPVAGCIGCGACRKTYSCVIHDDAAAEFIDLLWTVDEVHVVCPVYFSGPPSQFKALMDRLQPVWEYRCGPNAKRHTPAGPLYLHVIGMGGDPHGFDPLVTTVKSAFGAAGWHLREVIDQVGWGQDGNSDEMLPTLPGDADGDGQGDDRD